MINFVQQQALSRTRIGQESVVPTSPTTRLRGDKNAYTSIKKVNAFSASASSALRCVRVVSQSAAGALNFELFSISGTENRPGSSICKRSKDLKGHPSTKSRLAEGRCDIPSEARPTRQSRHQSSTSQRRTDRQFDKMMTMRGSQAELRMQKHASQFSAVIFGIMLWKSITPAVWWRAATEHKVLRLST
ncbi:hypothetical protein BDZ45DRAFT_743448 [Acephala macrosclerotiorum]|nr:hypothetical protein BDZ45DRAFT_743448 [Acephala macrosclerotiorum]